ncbi:unnamed protein product, partial [Medioppia subpectinata]
CRKTEEIPQKHTTNGFRCEQRVVSNRRVCRNRDLLLVGHRLAIQLIVFLHVFRRMAVSHCLLIGSTHSSQTGGIVRRHARWTESRSAMSQTNRRFLHRNVHNKHKKTLKSYFYELFGFVRNKCFSLDILFDTKLSVKLLERWRNTEIDWSTYVEQVQCFLNGSLNYSDIKGETGPISSKN